MNFYFGDIKGSLFYLPTDDETKTDGHVNGKFIYKFICAREINHFLTTN